jgi:hypothetical protein
MNYLDILAKIIKFNSKKQKKDNLKSSVVLAVAGVAIVGVAVAFFTKGCCEQIKNVVIKNLEDSDEDKQDDINEYNKQQKNIIRHEIKETLSKYLEEMPVTIPDTKNPEMNIKTLQDYYNSLESLLKKYSPK